MDEKELKTTTKQRVIIGLIAVIMIGSMIASYAAIVLNGGGASNSNNSSQISDAKIQEYTDAYSEQAEEFAKATKADFDEFIAYKSEIKAFNEESANASGVQVKELKEGSGATVAEDGSNYLAYYVGYCADESIFDSSFDDEDNPTGFSKALDPSLGMIEGWTEGVKGMKIGGIRRITVPESLAYGDSMEICGGYNKPLRFIVMAVANEEPLKSEAAKLDEAYMRYQYAVQYGIDYDEMMKADDSE
ncbi:FKBP-type peptidyl-prolyl cis-trans isomerase [Candidatus Saccharibacteria bacterium]|nr:FKBP-type peptidyl-prolyl cis-trans isomerase [Candidatus Saccharibacteria bacterium]